MKCLNCNNEINENSNFCEYCGTKIEKQINNYCSNCGSLLNSGNFCSSCGTKINNNLTIYNQTTNNHLLTVTRQKKTLGFAVSFTVHVDGNIIGKLKNGESLSCSLNPGKHVVNIESVEKNTIEEIIINDNTNSVEIIVVAKMGIIAANAKIVDVIYK